MISLMRRMKAFIARRIFGRTSELSAGPFNYYFLSEKPRIILTFTSAGLAHIKAMARLLPHEPTHFLLGFWWDMARMDRVKALEKEWIMLKNAYPHVHLHLLCNAQAEQQLFTKKTRLSAHLINHNCFLDESIYKVEDDVAKRYDALYNGRLGSYKRLELASGIDRLAIITAPLGNDTDTPYGLQMRTELSHADWLNYNDQGEYQRIHLRDICTTINQAHVGLVLSAVEGACYASCEYLLCGLPVVSTASKGGRDEMFTPQTATIVEDHPDAVAEGVAAWLREGFNPLTIRMTTVEIMKMHRQRLFKLVDKLRSTSAKRLPFEQEWPELFTNKMNYKTTLSEFEKRQSLPDFLEVIHKRKQAADHDNLVANT